MFGKTLPRSEKLKAVGVFGAIALSSAVAFDLMLFSGFQVDPPASRTAQAAEPTSSYLDVIDGGWRSDYVTSATSWDTEAMSDPAFLEDEHAERLAGDVRASEDGYRSAVYDVPSEDELYQEIAALYAEQDRRAAARAAENPAVKEEIVDAEANPEPVTAYESASPW